MLMAWNTGHPGGACTAHADSCIDGLTRIEMLSRMSPSTRVMDVSVLRSVIARAVGLVVYIAKIWIDTPEGLREVRRVLDVVRVTGLDEKDNFVVEQV
jgi:type IV secretion system protein TrbB